MSASVDSCGDNGGPLIGFVPERPPIMPKRRIIPGNHLVDQSVGIQRLLGLEGKDYEKR